MKNLNISFTDAEFRKLKKAKESSARSKYSWENFIIAKCTKGISEKRKVVKHKKIKCAYIPTLWEVQNKSGGIKK